MVKRFFLFLHEADINWKGVDVLAHFLAESVYVVESCRIFLCRDDTTGLGELLEGLINQLDVLCLETMMVGKSEWRDILDEWGEVVGHLLW